MTLLGSDLIIPLNRPEYVAIPEGFLSALAWSVYEVSNLTPDPDGKKIGLRFHQDHDLAANNNFVIRVTEPLGPKLAEFDNALEKYGLNTLGSSSSLGSAILNSIRGTKASKGIQVPASPLSPSLSLLQNSVGLQGKRNPPDVAEILQTMFELGAKDDGEETLGLTLAKAYSKRLAIDPFLRVIDQAINDVVWDGTLKQKEVEAARVRKGSRLAPYLSETPFRWFSETWAKLMSDEWINALPTRVWVDWVTTSLRSIYALGFLWETTWYEAVAREVLDDSASEGKGSIENILKRQDAPIVWRQASSGAEIRDLSSKLKWRCYRSVEIRQLIDKWLKDTGSESKELNLCLALMKKDAILRSKLTSALNLEKASTSGPGSNLWEAIRYTLLAREAGDFYGFFRNRGSRFLFAEPGSEWVAVMASLSSPHPGVPTDLGAVSQKLKRLGANPHPNDLLRFLESAGLARGSADADLGVIVETAFGEKRND